MNSVTPIWPAVFLGMYLFLELLDWGLSLAAPFVARNQEENKAVLSLLKPGIDLNEAWLIFGLSLVASARASRRTSPCLQRTRIPRPRW